jgi:hypothetical protein
MKSPTLRTFAVLTIVVAFAYMVPRPPSIHAQEAPPRFSSGVTLVPITAVVRDSRNRLVRDLGRDDFQVLEQGMPRPIVDFRAQDDAPIMSRSCSIRAAACRLPPIWRKAGASLSTS